MVDCAQQIYGRTLMYHALELLKVFLRILVRRLQFKGALFVGVDDIIRRTR